MLLETEVLIKNNQTSSMLLRVSYQLLKVESNINIQNMNFSFKCFAFFSARHQKLNLEDKMILA